MILQQARGIFPDYDIGEISTYNMKHNGCNCMALDAEECVSILEGYGPNVDVAMLYHEPCDCPCHITGASGNQEQAMDEEYQIALREGGYYACFPEKEGKP